MKRKCAACEEAILINKENSNRAIHYKKRFYHFDCFSSLCDQKMSSKRSSSSWADAKLHIEDLVRETTREQQNEIAKDEIIKWMTFQYDISCVSGRLFMKLNDIYSGTFNGLAYPILPVELMEEWKYYWDELCTIRRHKTLVGEQAINYDIAILLNRNAEYRRRKQREQLAREIRQQQENDAVVIDTTVIKKQTKRHKIADLYTEMTGGENDE